MDAMLKKILILITVFMIACASAPKEDKSHDEMLKGGKKPVQNICEDPSADETLKKALCN